jgi:hypothetical protein
MSACRMCKSTVEVSLKGMNSLSSDISDKMKIWILIKMGRRKSYGNRG